MKKITLSILALVWFSTSISAQTAFQGSIEYEMEMSGEGLEEAAAFLPSGMVIQVRKKAMKLYFEGGMLPMLIGEILTDGKKGESWMVKASEKTAYRMPTPEEGEMPPKPTVERMDETLEIAGHTCQKYKTTTQTDAGDQVQYLWVAEDLSMPAMSGGGGPGIMGTGAISGSGVPGLPLKIMSNTNGISVVLTAKSVESGKLPKKDFKIPKGYDKKDFDPASLMGGMGM